MKQDKEQWTEEVMRSLDGMRQAEPGPFLYHRIMSNIKESAAYEVPKPAVWLAAASFALILLLNFQAIKKADGPAGAGQQELRELAVQYQMLNTNTMLYN